MRRRLCPKEALFTPSFIAVCSANLLFFIASFMMVPVLLINHKITEKEKRDNLGRRGIYFWQECNFVAEYVIEKEWGAPPF